MDKKKQSKEEKVGADGLTKKERRALKVQARQTDDNKAEQKNIRQHSVPKNGEKSEINQNMAEKGSENVTENGVIVEEVKVPLDKPESGLSMKEKRKLEWEKKLASVKNENNIETKCDQQLSKSEQKAKRREIQEAQRLAKKNTVTKNTEELNSKISPENKKIDSAATKSFPAKHTCSKRFDGSILSPLQMPFRDYKPVELYDSVCLPNIHPAFIELGVQYSSKTILGSNARCISLLCALSRLVKDLRTPPEQEFSRYLELVLQKSTSYLQKCRPMSVSMTNALKLFKSQLTQIDSNIPDEDIKKKLLDFIDTFIHDEILTAGKAISLKVLEKISNGDIILIYGCSSLIKRILIEAFESKKQFKVIVVDNRPLTEGVEMLRRLTKAGIDCTCVSINGLRYVMASVTKIVLGAHSLLTNGYVMSRAGTSLIALAAKAFNRPVLVCCETYKFSERVQADSLVYNEIGDPDILLKDDTLNNPSPMKSRSKKRRRKFLNLLYDVTPAFLITAVVTELAILPCTSVPVVLRVKPIEI
ncbi:hypothetical protein WA026_006435 [Henosepilachna vigintioctopunctata]|uniref:Translation initiation factor eIF2B subunit delta n=1 Tax=Henosepilachna vigintioctopunctata TaxID=420089 RepID=A0AAW1TRE6_9CUCU